MADLLAANRNNQPISFPTTIDQLVSCHFGFILAQDSAAIMLALVDLNNTTFLYINGTPTLGGLHYVMG